MTNPSPFAVPPREMTLESRIEMTASARDADTIPKVFGAGEVFVDEQGRRLQRMHNGLKVEADGYCGAWMTRLIERCRGHHEPQEELAFHHLVARLSDSAVMMEIGGSWSYYSMWFLQDRPHRRSVILEPDPVTLALARRHLALNELTAETVWGYVGAGYGELVKTMPEPPPQVSAPEVLRERGIAYVDLLHCDAQGAELELIESCETLLREKRVGWLMASTHGATITGDPLTHQKCLARLRALGGDIALEHDIHESFSGDGLILARFAAEDSGPFPEVSRNRYSTSFYRNPLYDLAANASPATAPVGVWLELRRESALGAKGDLILTPTDGELSPYLVEHGEWRPEPLELARETLDPAGDYTLVDIGANVGLFARQFLRAFAGIRRCLCVEPDRRNFEALACNLRPFEGRGIELFNFALAERAGGAAFYRDADNIGNFSLHLDAMRHRNFNQVEVATVDAASWAEQHLADARRIILKTDTQGSDEAIATRIPLSIWRNVAFACLEIWRIDKPPYDAKALREIIESFPHRSFRDVRNGPVDDILDYASGRDWMFYDLYLWR